MKSTSMILSAALAACAFIAFGSAVTPPDEPVLVDTSASAGSVVASSSSSTVYPATKAFDGAWSTISSDRWLAYINPNKNDYTGGLTGETPAYVTYKFNTATRVNTLRIRIPSDKDYACSDRAPKAWTFSGSNNGSDWVTLDTRSGITWASGTTTKTFAFENETKYEYYKFSCSEIGGTNDYLQIYELQFLCARDMTALVCSSELTIPSAPATALENFPVLVRISPTAIDGFSYAACPMASHLWFTDAGGTTLPFEVDTWDVSGTSLVWVSVPSLSSSTAITMHWAGDTANVPNDMPASREVWTRAGYRAVWHFSGSAAESVTNLAATAVGSPSYNGNASYPGPLGKTLWLNGSSYLSFANNSSWATLGEDSSLTISCWARATGAGYARMISSMSNWDGPAGYELTLQNSYTQITVGSSGKSQFQTDIATGPNTAWKHFTATYAGTNATLYVDGAYAKSNALNKVITPTEALSLGAESDGGNKWSGGLDEVRIRAAASTAAWIAAEYATMTSAAYVSCGAAATDSAAPVIATPVVTIGAGGAVTVTAVVSDNAPTAVRCVIGNVTDEMSTTDTELPMTYSTTFLGLATDTTYAGVVTATYSVDSAISRSCPAFFTGDLSVTKVSDASETGLVPGVFRISRADTAHDLPVAYTVGGTATAGQTYEALSGTAIIPAGASYVDIEVAPLLDSATTVDTTVIVTLAAGLYGIDAQFGSAELTIENHEAAAPDDFAKKIVVTPSATALAKIGESTFADFPVLVRLPAEASALLQAADGTDLLVMDETGMVCPFEVDTFAPSGETLVWVKVPSLSASTELTVYFGGTANLDNDPTEVWTDYVGVWHMNEASGTVADATGHGLGAASAKNTAGSVAYAGGVVGNARQTAVNGTMDYLTIPNYNSQNVGGNFTFSCWYDATARLGYDRLVSRKTAYDAGNGWEVELANSNAKLSARGASSTSISAEFSDIVSTGWMRFAFVYSGSTLKAYLNGVQKGSGSITAATDNGLPLSIGCNSNGSEAYFVGYVDEARLRKGAASAAEVALEHATMADAAFFEYGNLECVDATATRFETPTAVRNANGTYTVSVVLAENSGAVGVIYNAGTTAITNIIAQSATPDTYTDTPANLVSGTTYAFAAYGRNANDTEVTKKGGVFYNGDLSVERISDAAENGLLPGVFRITRVDTAHDLPIAYTVGGTATAGQTYEALSGTAIIPAGASYVDIEVAPLLDSVTTVDTTVTVTLAAGLYGIDAQAGSAELTVVNLATPSGYNTWIAQSAGLASVGSNWSEGHSPTASENLLFDGRFSSANCEWDSAASATVASWTQTNGYTGTVTFDTEFPDYAGATFTLFTISGDCVIASGKWSCRGNYNNFGASVTPMNTYKTDKRWCLNVAVGGAMTVASGTAITATGRGYGYTNGIASPAYGGYAWGGGSSPYGSIKEPFDLGLGSRSQSDQNNRISGIGGGAIKLVITGTLTLDGSIVALGTADQNIARAGGTGGSIWIAANQISGAGTIDASAPTGVGNDQIVGTGSGGRIALYTQSPLAFPIANVACSGTGYQGTKWAWNSRVSGPGTIYVYDPTQTYGTLYVKQSTNVSTQNTKWTGTPVMGDLALDAVVISGCASLRIPEGASLTLPSLAAVTTSNTGSGNAGLVYDGGTLNIGNGDQTLKANVAFASPTAFVFPGDLALETGAKLGSLNSMYGTAAHCYDQTFTVSVAGNLTIPTGASAGATRCCALTAGSTGRRTATHGGQSLYLEEAARTNGFDSVLSPTMPGGSMNSSFPAGGAFTLTVGGTLTLDGAITADGGEARGSGSTYAGASAGAGGTINVTAGALAGEGKITADGGCGGAYYAGGAGGGRVSVRLAGAASTFSDWWTTNILARGQSLGSYTAKASSAGTVYLQEAANGEAGGLVVIRNDLAVQAAAANNNATTRYPGNGDGCDTPAALKKTSLLVAGAAHVELTDIMRSTMLEIESGSSIDLAGKVFTVNAAKLGETRFPTGTYMAGDAAVAGFITDSVGGGKLVITGGGFTLIVR